MKSRRFIQVVCFSLLATMIAAAGCAKDSNSGPVTEVAQVRTQAKTPSVTTKPASTQPAPEVSGEVIAAGLLQVHDDFVTIDDVLRPLRKPLGKLGESAVSRKRFEQQARQMIRSQIHSTISSMLVLNEAKLDLTERQRMMVDAEVDHAKAEMITSAGGSETRLKQDLTEEGFELEQVLDDHRQNVIIRLYLRSKFLPQLHISRRDLWKQYKKDIESYKSEKKVGIRIIAIPKSIDGAKDKTLAVREVLKAGGDFAEMAKDVAGRLQEKRANDGRVYRVRMRSSGGLWPEMSPESFREDVIAQAANDLSQGELSKVIEGENCFFIVRADQVQNAKTVGFEEAQRGLRRKIRAKRYQEFSEAYMQRLFQRYQDLHAEAGLEALREFADLTLQCAIRKYWKPS